MIRTVESGKLTLMNILGISGSPNSGGNTAEAVLYALNIAGDTGCSTKFFSLGERRIHTCDGCWNCASAGVCIHDDGMTELYEAMRWCDGLILGSPVYMGMVTGQMKTFMDRCVLLRPSYQLPVEMSGKAGGGIACGGFRNGGQETTLQNIHTFLLQQNMRVVNDGAPYSHAGGTITGTTKEDSLGLETVRNLALNIISAARLHK